MSPSTKKIVIWIVGAFALIGFIFTMVFIAMQFGLLNVRGSISERNSFFENTKDTPSCTDQGRTICDWNTTAEWEAIKGGLLKDESIISRVSTETGVAERMIVAVVVPEQTRFFTSEREEFKRYFEPLKILGSLSQFSLGVSGIKQETARLIEAYAASTTSPFYPGTGMAELIRYSATTTNHDTELYNRLTDSKNHYYSYLYTALYIKEIESQWEKAGYDVSKKPEVIVTLFNIGFQGSNPNPQPKTGGAIITVGGKQYTYGELGSAFYFSDELPEFTR